MQDGSPDFGVRHVHLGCQPPSDEGCCRDARSPGPRLTQGEVKTTSNASVTPHQQQPPTQQPQPRHTTLPRLRPRIWTWITPNAYLPRVCFGRRPAVRRKPHKYRPVWRINSLVILGRKDKQALKMRHLVQSFSFHRQDLSGSVRSFLTCCCKFSAARQLQGWFRS